MQGVYELSKALITLAQKILQRDEIESLHIAKLLLLDIDRVPFKSMFDRWGCKNFSSLQQTLDNYYLTSFGEQIRWESNEVRVYGDDFVEIFIFILDLALKSGRNSYIEEILTMDQSYQETLLPFVKAVTERDSYVEKADGEKRDENLFDLLQQNDKLKRLCDEWIQKYQQLKGEYDDLKSSHEKMSEELHLLKQDHQLVNEIGGSVTVEEALEKVKKEFAEYERSVDKMKKQLDEKKTQLIQREEENRNLEISFKTFRNLEKTEELEKANQLVKTLEESLASAKSQEEDARIALEECRETIKERDNQLESLKSKISSLEAQAQKFTNIRRLHNQYRDKILKEYRQLRE